MTTFKQIYNQINKMIEMPILSDEEIIKYLNMTQEKIEGWCIIPQCYKQFKNYRGMRIHLAKFHKLRLNSHE